jgi:hypothetical protein
MRLSRVSPLLQGDDQEVHSMGREQKRLAAKREVQALYPHIQPFWLPSPAIHRRFEPWVLWTDGADDTGNLLGWCPIHDKDKQMDGSAEFNFFKNIMRCQGDPPCHIGKRSMSLTNVINAMINDGE